MELGQWYGAWVYKSLDMRIYPLYLLGQRQTFHFISTIGGNCLRLRFSAIYNLSPLMMESVYVRVGDNEAQPVFLNGEKRIQIQPGQEILSDELAADIAPGDRISIQIDFEDCISDTACTFYDNPFCQVEHRNREGQEHLPTSPFFERNPLHRCVTGFDQVMIRSSGTVRTIAAFGDSITHMSRWTGPLAMRLIDAYPGQFVFHNFGVCGNRILHDGHRLSGHGRWFGQAGLRRFKPDLFSDSIHADEVLLLQGINDLLHPWVGAAPMNECVSAKEILGGLEEMAAIAHGEGANVSIGTLMPFNGCKQHWTPEREKIRQEVNDGIRSSHAFDQLLDWDTWTKWDKDPTRLDPSGESEDLLHPGIAGGIAMADHVNLPKLFEA